MEATNAALLQAGWPLIMISGEVHGGAHPERRRRVGERPAPQPHEEGEVTAARIHLMRTSAAGRYFT